MILLLNNNSIFIRNEKRTKRTNTHTHRHNVYTESVKPNLN